jgi:hypothetical protein
LLSTTRSGNINTNNNRRQVGPLQAIAPGPVRAIVSTATIGVMLVIVGVAIVNLPRAERSSTSELGATSRDANNRSR